MVVFEFILKVFLTITYSIVRLFNLFFGFNLPSIYPVFKSVGDYFGVSAMPLYTIDTILDNFANTINSILSFLGFDLTNFSPFMFMLTLGLAVGVFWYLIKVLIGFIKNVGVDISL